MLPPYRGDPCIHGPFKTHSSVLSSQRGLIRRRASEVFLKAFWCGFCVSLAITLAGPASPARARTLTDIKATGVLRVGLTGDYAPYSLHGPDAGITGADVAMVQTLARDLNVALQIIPTTWKSITTDFEAGRFDIAMGGVSVTPARAAIGAFSIPVMSDGKRPIVRCGDRDRYSSVAAIDRSAVRVAVNPGGTNETFARTHFPHATFKEYPDNQTIFDGLASGRVDVMVTDGAEVDFQTHRHPGVLCPADVKQAFDHFERPFG